MKTITAFVLFSIISVSLFSQQLDGRFQADSDYIVFSGNNIQFNVSGFAGLRVAQVGEGTFEVVDNFLIVNTTPFSGIRSTVEAVDATSEGHIIVQVVDEEIFWIPSVFVESRDRRGRTIERVLTNNQGIANLTRSDNVHSIYVSNMGYDNISIDYTPGMDFQVMMVNHTVIENTTAVFRFNLVDNQLSLLLLTSDFNPGRNATRSLRQLDDRAQRANRMERRYRRVLEPVEIDWRR